MKQIYSWDFDLEELAIIKSGLMQFDKRSPYYEKAQAIAAALPVQPIHHGNDRQEGLTNDIVQSLLVLKSATAPEIEEYLGLPKPNSVSAICSKLAKQGLLVREEVPPSESNSRGLTPKYRYSIQ